MPLWAKLLLIFGIGGAALMILTCAGLVFIGTTGPDIKAVPGSNMRSDEMKVINSLGLLEPGEQILYFYSDALLTIEAGMYFCTDLKVVVYREDAAEPTISATYDEIVDITAEFDDSFFVDSMFYLDLEDGSTILFPVSSEAGGDRRFFDSLTAAWKKTRQEPDP